jgi:hypothetical protein
MNVVYFVGDHFNDAIGSYGSARHLHNLVVAFGFFAFGYQLEHAAQPCV